ncbi:3'(2'),5'-bisphosphate nucleotidase 1 isoform X1 [Tachypleus tridentatus]|uniref:3'(2'),5'-bisphosphate nucleotidase 1 isoform X1 n=1 Tax=Tachypleus tridentatus TaxID=6853 RepID=UPI003FD67E1C
MAASSSAAPVLLRILSASVSVVNRAGKIIKDVMKKGDLGIVDKGIDDLQTEADRSVQHCIVTSLSRQFPKIAIIGEEELDSEEKVLDEWIVTSLDSDVLAKKCPADLASVPEEKVVVWVDPLDGTSEYTQGLLDHVTVLVGIAVNGKAIGGVIHQPYYNYQPTRENYYIEKDVYKQGRTLWGMNGLGVFGIEKKAPCEGKRIITTTRSHSNKNVNLTIDAMKPDEVLRVGGAGHKVLLLIEGRAHAYVFASKGCKKWDTCAPEALLHILGGKLTDMHGNSLEYHKDIQHLNSGGVLATYDAAVHEWYRERVPEEVKKSLPP